MAFASTRGILGSSMPPWTATRRATVTVAGALTRRGRRVASAPVLGWVRWDGFG